MIPPRDPEAAGPGEGLPATDPRYRAVSAVLEAFMTRDCDAVLELCTPGVTFEFPFIGDSTLDAATFRRTIQRTVTLMEGLRFYDLVASAAGGSTVVARYRSTATIRTTGWAYAQKYISLFDFADGKLAYFQENFDTATFKAAFDLDPGWRMR